MPSSWFFLNPQIEAFADLHLTTVTIRRDIIGKSFPYIDAKLCDLTYCCCNFVWKVCVDYTLFAKNWVQKRFFFCFTYVHRNRPDVNIK